MFRGGYFQRRLGRVESPDYYIRCSLSPKYCAGARGSCVWLEEAGSGRGPVGNIACGTRPVHTARLPDRLIDMHVHAWQSPSRSESFKQSLLEAFTAFHLERADVRPRSNRSSRGTPTPSRVLDAGRMAFPC